MKVKKLIKQSNKQIAESILEDWPILPCRCYGDCDGECYDSQRERIKQRIQELIQILDEKDK